jgi:NAD(P)-dependent dehydrogenase (short-subunit alcohol dehydrogenase family)
MTGGSIIGTALAEAGADIVVCSRNLDACKEVSEELKKLGVDSFACHCDISKKDDIEAVIDDTLRAFGKVDILVSNSGISWISPLLEFPEDKWM